MAGKDKKKDKKKKEKHKKGKKGDLTTFTGVALFRGSGKESETVIVPDLKTARLMSLGKAEMSLLKAAFAAGAAVTGKCARQKQNGTIRCLPGTCTGKCHLFRARLPLDPEKPKIEDLGETGTNYVEMEQGYGYWCDCV